MLASPAHCWSANMVNSRKTVVGEDAVGFRAEAGEVRRKLSFVTVWGLRTSISQVLHATLLEPKLSAVGHV